MSSETSSKACWSSQFGLYRYPRNSSFDTCIMNNMRIKGLIGVTVFLILSLFIIVVSKILCTYNKI